MRATTFRLMLLLVASPTFAAQITDQTASVSALEGDLEFLYVEATASLPLRLQIDFGDGEIHSAAEPLDGTFIHWISYTHHAWTDNGAYTVTFSANDGGGPDTETIGVAVQLVDDDGGSDAEVFTAAIAGPPVPAVAPVGLVALAVIMVVGGTRRTAASKQRVSPLNAARAGTARRANARSRRMAPESPSSWNRVSDRVSASGLARGTRPTRETTSPARPRAAQVPDPVPSARVRAGGELWKDWFHRRSSLASACRRSLRHGERSRPRDRPIREPARRRSPARLPRASPPPKPSRERWEGRPLLSPAPAAR